MPGQQRAFDAFRADYNERRPHEALGQKPPASRYAPSFRAMPERPAPPTYGDDFSVRWVQDNGAMQWKGARVYVGQALGTQPLGLLQIDEAEWEVHFGPLLLGYVLIRNGVPVLENLS